MGWVNNFLIDPLGDRSTANQCKFQINVNWLKKYFNWAQNTSRADCQYLSHVMRKPVYAKFKQQRHRSACASTQSDQHLCCLLPIEYNISSFYIKNLKPLVSLCSWEGRFESYLVANPEDRFFSQPGSLDSKWVKYCSNDSDLITLFIPKFAKLVFPFIIPFLFIVLGSWLASSPLPIRLLELVYLLRTNSHVCHDMLTFFIIDQTGQKCTTLNSYSVAGKI